MAKTNARAQTKRKPTFEAYAQGGLDGLCGIYSTINAVQYLRGRALNEAAAIELFKYLVGAVANKLPEMLWEGTGVPEVRSILHRADDFARRHYGFGLARSEPMLKQAPAQDDLYWARLDELLKPKARVLIVGLKEPWEHWSVLTDVTPRTLRFLDSLTIKVARRADFSLRKGATYQIGRQVFLLQRVEV